MNVKEILKEYLQKNKFDGLCNDLCGCSLDDLIPCGDGAWNEIATCEPAYLNENCELGYSVQKENKMKNKHKLYTDVFFDDGNRIRKVEIKKIIESSGVYYYDASYGSGFICNAKYIPEAFLNKSKNVLKKNKLKELLNQYRIDKNKIIDM